METQIIKGYKALNRDMSSAYGDMEYEVGKQYCLDGKLELCRKGYHFCKNMMDIFQFYDIDDSRIFEIEASGNVISNSEKSCTDNIRLIRELSEEEIATIVNKNYNNEDVYIREVITQSKYANNETLSILSKDEDSIVRCRVAESLNVNAKILEKLSNDDDWYVRYAVAKNSNTCINILEELSNDNDWSVRLAVSQNSNTDVKILEKLSEDKAIHVRHIANENLNKKSKIL